MAVLVVCPTTPAGVSFQTRSTRPTVSIHGRLLESPVGEVDNVTGVVQAALRVARKVAWRETEPSPLIAGHVTAAIPARFVPTKG